MHETLRQQGLVGGVVEVRAVVQRRHLVADGLHHPGVRVADVLHGDARREVEVDHPVGIPDLATLAAHEGHGGGVCMHYILVKQRSNVFILAHQR